MDIAIKEGKQEADNECFDKCFDDEVLDLRRKKRGSKFGANKEENIYGGISLWETKFLPSNYQFPLMTFSQLILNWLLGSVSENVPPI